MTEETGSGWENKALRMPRAVLGTGKMEGVEAPSGMGEAVAAGAGEGAVGPAPAVGETDGSLAMLPSTGPGGARKGEISAPKQTQPLLSHGGVGAGRGAGLRAPEEPPNAGGSSQRPGCRSPEPLSLLGCPGSCFRE